MARSDLEALLNVLIPMADKMLAEQGEFYPFAAAMDVSDNISPWSAQVDQEHPSAQEVFDKLVAGLRGSAAELKATGVCFDGRVTPPDSEEETDAVCICLEDRDGEAIDVFVPYRIDSDSGEIEYGELFAVRGEPAVFAGA